MHTLLPIAIKNKCPRLPFLYFRAMKTSFENITIRTISPADNQELAAVIRATLKEFGANRPGTVYFDPTTDQLFELFQTPNSFYQVAIHNDHVIGGGGIFHSDGLPADTCELVKMYLLTSWPCLFPLTNAGI